MTPNHIRALLHMQMTLFDFFLDDLDDQAVVVCGPPELVFEVCLNGPDILPLVAKEWAGLEHVLWRLIVISTMTGCSVCLPGRSS